MKLLPHLLSLAPILVLTAAGQDVAPAPAPAPAKLDARLERLVDQLEAKRVEYHIPGMQLAVVLDDQTVLVHSFGVLDVETQTPTTDDTLFAIGSVTKSFTSALIAELVDDGVMSWDAPITDYLPGFVLNVDLPEDLSPEEGSATPVLIRDLLSHRTGFTRMQILAANNSLSPERTLAAAIHAEPWAPFRSAFLYNNVQFLASGMAAGKAAGSDWHTLVEERLLEPLHMQSTFTSLRRVPADRAVITGHQWNEEDEDYDVHVLRVIDNIAPAGAILSTAADMARWARFHLNRGELDGERLLSPEQHAALWERQAGLGPNTGYGFGWMLHEKEGARVIEHGGNVRGGSAQLALYPDEGLGFVLLMNVGAAVLQQESISIVRDAVLGALPDETQEAIDSAPYVGEYVGNIGTFQDTTFTVQEKGGTLAVDVPGQMLFELKPPDEEGRWFFAITDQVAVSFELGDDGKAVGMRFHQGGMIFELPRKGHTIEPEIPLVELERYLGSYHCEDADITVQFVIQSNRLAVDWPQEMVYELRPPNEEGLRLFRVIDMLRLRFDEGEDGRILGVTCFRGPNKLVFERRLTDTEALMPTADEVLANRGSEERAQTLAALGCVKFEGRIRLLQSGVDGSLVLWAESANRVRIENDCGDYGWFRMSVLGDEGVMDISFVDTDELDSAARMRTWRETPLAWVGDWRDEFTSIKVLKAGLADGAPTWVLKMENENEPAHTVTVDQASGDVIRVETNQPIPGMGIALPVTHEFGKFREIEGLRIPMEVTVRTDMSGAIVSDFETVECNVPAEDDLFRIVPRERPQPWVAPRPSGK